MTQKTNLLNFTLSGLTDWFAGEGEKPFRAKQVFQWIHQRGVADFDAMTDLAKAFRAHHSAVSLRPGVQKVRVVIPDAPEGGQRARAGLQVEGAAVIGIHGLRIVERSLEVGLLVRRIRAVRTRQVHL